MKNNLLYNLNYIDIGDGPPVVLLHGVAGSLRQWDYLTPVLTQAGYRTLAVDLLGHGDSSWSSNPRHMNGYGGYHIESLIEHYLSWLEDLHLSDPPIIIAHSMGSYLALNHVIRGHPVRGLVLASPYYTPRQLSRPIRLSVRRPAVSTAFLQNTPLWCLESIIRLSHRNGTTSISDEIRRQMAIDFKRFDPRIIALPHSTEDMAPRLQHIRVPTMLIWGDKDLTLAPSSFFFLGDAIPDAKSLAIPDCGHVPHLSHQELFNLSTLMFLQEISAPKVHKGENRFFHAEHHPRNSL